MKSKMKLKNANSTILYGGAVVVVLALIVFAISAEREPSVYDDFAQCLTDEGVTMYGTWWCPYCQKQKDELGDSFDLVTYIECSSPGSQAMNSTCKAAGIEGYPTWEFSDGSRTTGKQELSTLSEVSGCELPGEGV